MLQRFDRPRLGMFLIPLLLITLFQLAVQQVHAAASASPDDTHPCLQLEDSKPAVATGDSAPIIQSCCEQSECQNPACQDLCAMGNMAAAPGLLVLPAQVGSNIYYMLPMISFSDALPVPPFHPPRYS